MSKIHEALKKSAQESGLRQADSPLLGDEFKQIKVLREESLPNIAEPRPMNGGPFRGRPEGSLQFEKLLARCARAQWVPDPEVVLFADSNGSSGAEQFRTLRTRLDKIRETKPLKRLQITSAISGEGKTFVATNLAQAISKQHDRRVLLVDADLRRSRLHLPLRAPQSPGLSDYLLGQSSEPNVVQYGGTGSLFFIPGGTHIADPSELLSSGRFQTLLDRMSQIFDWIIVDSPPCLSIADAQAISAACDGVLIVVRSGFTPLAAAHQAGEELKERNIVGLVVNGLRDVEQFQYHYAKGYDYGRLTSRASQSPFDS